MELGAKMNTFFFYHITLSASPRSFTVWANMASAIGDRQMLPEKGKYEFCHSN